MHILFATVQPFPPEMVGGLQRSAATLANRLRARGHQVSLLCALIGGRNRFGRMSRLKLKLRMNGPHAVTDHSLGFPVHRTWHPWEALQGVVEQQKPDVIVILARQPVRMGLEAMKTGRPVVMMVQDVEFGDHGGDFSQLDVNAFVANSEFTARIYREAFGVESEVIHPIVEKETYQTQPTGDFVTFVNPHPKKGVDIALRIAEKCPEIPFQFVEAWPLDPEERQGLTEQIDGLPNVTFRPSVDDMREIYGNSHAMLLPSRWKEAFGRVVVEAHCSGLPVIGSDRGGIPEAVGKGGILIDPDGPIDQWVDAVRQVWSHKPTHARLSRAALKNLERPAFDIQQQTDAWERVLLTHAGMAPAEQRFAAA